MLARAVGLQRAIILNGLQELSNASETGRSCRVVFEANENEHWLLCSPARIQMDWPFASPPADSPQLKECFGLSLQVDSWEMDSYVILAPACPDVDSLVTGIDRAFQELFGLGPGYALTYRIEGE